jgi:hypothetical protein
MPLLLETADRPDAITDSKARRKTAGTKLSIGECAALDTLCRRLNTTPGEFIRGLILAKIHEPQAADPLLAEIVGIRLMLRNLLAPLAAGMEPMTKQRVEAILDEIKRLQPQVALDIQRSK